MPLFIICNIVLYVILLLTIIIIPYKYIKYSIISIISFHILLTLILLFCCFIYYIYDIKTEYFIHIFNLLIFNKLNICMNIHINYINIYLLGTIFFIGILIQLYSLQYIINYEYIRMYWFLINAFIFFTTGFIVSNDIIIMLFFLDIIGTISYFLIGIKIDTISKMKVDNIIFYFNKISSSCLLAAIILILYLNNTTNINYSINTYNSSIITFLILIFSYIKLSQWPFTNWIISAMSAVIPISAFIHTTTITTIGILIIIKMSQIIDTSISIPITFYISFITNLVCSYKLLFSFNIKEILAYLTVIQYSHIMVLTVINKLLYSILCIIIHAFYKSLFFLVLGLILLKKNKINIKNIYIKIKSQIYLYYTISSFIISGFPFLNSFFIKNIILHNIYTFDNINFYTKYALILSIIISYTVSTIVITKQWTIITSNTYKNDISINIVSNIICGILVIINVIICSILIINYSKIFDYINYITFIHSYYITPFVMIITFIYYYFNTNNNINNNSISTSRCYLFNNMIFYIEKSNYIVDYLFVIIYIFIYKTIIYYKYINHILMCCWKHIISLIKLINITLIVVLDSNIKRYLIFCIIIYSLILFIQLFIII